MEQFKGVIRAILAAGAGYLAGKGIIPAEGVDEMVSAVLLLITVIWSAADKKTAAVKLEKAIAAPEGKAE